MLRKIGAVNFIDHFKYGALTITLPLYLISRGIDVGEIGLVLSLLPLAFMIVRVISSVYGDVVGVKPFFIGNTILHTVTSIIFLFAKTPLQFGVGKISEGAAGALFWAVDRTAIIARAHASKYLMVMSVVREFAAALGLVAAGLLITFVSFESVFLVLVGLGLVGVGISALMVNRGASVKKPEWKGLFSIQKRHVDFWEVSAAIVLLNSSVGLLFTFLLPVTMNTELGMGYLDIALMLAAFYVSMALGSLLSVRTDVNGYRLLFVQLVAVPLLVILPYSGMHFVTALLFSGFGYGVCAGISEAMVGHIAEAKRGASTRVALLMIPCHIASFLVLGGSGFVMEAIGSEVLFVFSAVTLGLFIVLSKRILGDFEGNKAKKIMMYRRHRGPATVQIRA